MLLRHLFLKGLPMIYIPPPRKPCLVDRLRFVYGFLWLAALLACLWSMPLMVAAIFN